METADVLQSVCRVRRGYRPTNLVIRKTIRLRVLAERRLCVGQADLHDALLQHLASVVKGVICVLMSWLFQYPESASKYAIQNQTKKNPTN